MVQCPSCGGGLDVSSQHAGSFYNCPQCHQYIFIGLDGQPQQVQHEHDVEEISNSPSFGEPSNVFSNSDESVSNDIEHHYQDSDSAMGHGFSNEHSGEASGYAAVPSAQSHEPTGAVAAPDVDSRTETMTESALETPRAQQVVIETNKRFSDSADLSDLQSSATQEFGNAQVRLKIQNIDDAETKDAVFEALVDSKLDIQLEFLENRFKDGVIELDPINAVQASVIMKRLKFLGITLQIEQQP